MIIDDHRLFADAVRSALEAEGIDVVGIAGNGEEGLAAARAARPSVVLTDLGLPDCSGLSVGESILRELPGTVVLALTAREDDRTIDEAIRLGFHGYVTKETGVDPFVSALRMAAEGCQVVVPASSGAERPQDRRSDPLVTELTPRELEVLQLLSQGLAARAIAERLGVSRNTVRTQVQSILTKFQVHSRLEAVAFGIRCGLIPRR